MTDNNRDIVDNKPATNFFILIKFRLFLFSHYYVHVIHTQRTKKEIK